MLVVQRSAAAPQCRFAKTRDARPPRISATTTIQAVITSICWRRCSGRRRGGGTPRI